METLFETYNLTLDYNELRGNEDEAFRLTLFNKYGNYEDEFYLSPKQIKDLKEGLESINLNDIDEKFYDEDDC